MEKELTKQRKILRQTLKENIDKYCKQLARFEEPLLHIFQHPSLKLEKKELYKNTYDELMKYLYNFKVLEEELENKDLTFVEEDIVIQESTAALYQASEYIKNLPLILAQDA